MTVPVPAPTGAPTTVTPVTGVTGASPSARVGGTLATFFVGTPGRMRLLSLVGVVATLLLGWATIQSVLAAGAAADRAATNTEQVMRTQAIHGDLLRADALATNAFLIGGLERPEDRTAYDAALSGVTRNLTAAAAAQPADRDALIALAEDVQGYTALVDQARAMNRVGLPVGAQYLTEASAHLRSDIIPVVDQVVQTNEARARAEFSRSGGVLVLPLALVALLGLLGIAVWLARTTHRYLNLSVTAALVLLTAGIVAALMTIVSAGQAAAQVERHDFHNAVAYAEMRTAANDARANESLTLIKRGSGGTYEKAWAASTERFAELAAPPVTPVDVESPWQAYLDEHAKVRALDDRGNWDAAVKLATDPKGGTTAPFEQVQTRLQEARDASATAAVTALRGITSATPWAIGLGATTLLAAWLFVRGLGQRIEDYR